MASIAVGATIRDGRIVIVDERPEAAIGLSASMVPMLEHFEAARTMMGVNMMRQWVAAGAAEPALVQTGGEPDVAGFWCGCNLLTAYVSLGLETFEDGIVISESAARRLGTDRPAEVGDKLSNRHGAKGVIAQIRPDEWMPHLVDGTPVDLAYSFMGLHTRLNFGQVREAVFGRIAHKVGHPLLIPPFARIGQDEVRRRLTEAGLPESGMETLRESREGKAFDRPSTVGWVYWGRTEHLSRSKITVSTGPERCMMQGEMEYWGLRNAGRWST